MSVQFSVYQKDGKKSGKRYTLKTPAFDMDPHDHAIYLAVKAEMTNARQGSHSTKTRADARGGGRKPWRQKGRGTARAGSRRSPIWVGGGRTFGPKPHVHHMKINRKLKQLARKSALAYKYREKAIKVIDSLQFDEPKSRRISDLLRAFDLSAKTVTILVSKLDKNLYLSCRNFPNLMVLEAAQASTYDILDCDLLLIEKEGFKKLNSNLLANS